MPDVLETTDPLTDLSSTSPPNQPNQPDRTDQPDQPGPPTIDPDAPGRGLDEEDDPIPEPNEPA